MTIAPSATEQYWFVFYNGDNLIVHEYLTVTITFTASPILG